MTQRVHDRPTANVPAGMRPHLDRILDDTRHDPYQAKQKYEEPTFCRVCGAVYENGRWGWGEVPSGAERVRCPACRRAADRLPAGFLTLEGPAVDERRDDLLALVANVETKEKSGHPLNRILAIEQRRGAIVVQTADIHLPKRIGEAIRRAFGGQLDLVWGDGEYVLRARWRG